MNWLACVALLMGGEASHAEDLVRYFDIPASKASQGLTIFAQQANVPLLYKNDDLRHKRSSAVHGFYTTKQALSLLLENSGVVASINSNGVLTATISRAPIAAPPRELVASPPQSTEKPVSGGTDLSSEVIVTAQFHAQPLHDAPLAITAIAGRELVDSGYTDITGLSQLAPSVDFTSTGAYGGKTLAAFIRGIGASDYNFGVEPGVAFYMDDVYLGPSYGTLLLLDVGDLERIEVLRGPQGTLFGKDAIGGAVRLVSQKPLGEGTGYIQLDAGSLSMTRVRAAYDMPLIDDQLFLRVSGYSSQHDGYVELLDFACVNPNEAGNTRAPYGLRGEHLTTCIRGNLGDENVRAAKAQLRWLPASNLEINLSGDYIDDRSNGAADVLIGINPAGFTQYNETTAIPLYGVPYDTRFLPPSRFSSYATFSNPQYGLTFPAVDTLVTEDATLSADWQILTYLSLASITAYRQYSGCWSYDSDSSPLATDGVVDNQIHHQVSEELRLTGTSLRDRLSWTLGSFYYSGRERDIATIYAALYNLFINTDSRPEDTHYAAYLHTELNLTRQLNLIVGLRQSHERKTYLYVEEDIPGTPSTAFPGGFYHPAYTGYSHFDYRAALQYRFSPTLMAYLDVATGFRGGGFNPRPANAAQALGYGPERLLSYEAGSRMELLGGRISFDNTAYISHYKGIQLTADIANAGAAFPDAVVTNAGAAKIYGLESELHTDINDWLSVAATGSYTHFAYTQLGIGVGLDNGPSLESDQTYTPRWKANLTGQLRLPWGERYGRLTLQTSFSWRSLQYADAANSPQMGIPAYGLLNARLALAMDSGWTVAAGGTNITNQFYYSAKNFISGDWQWKGVPGLPAQWYLSVRRSLTL